MRGHPEPLYRVFWRRSAPTTAGRGDKVSVPSATPASLAPLHHFFDDHFNTLWRSPVASDFTNHMLEEFSGLASPRSIFPVNVIASKEAYDLTAELPGFTEGDVSVSLEGRTLTISASQESSREEKDEESVKVLLAERRVKKFSRAFQLPADADEEAEVKAVMEHGILHVSLPRKGVSTPSARSIPVQTGAASKDEA